MSLVLKVKVIISVQSVTSLGITFNFLGFKFYSSDTDWILFYLFRVIVIDIRWT